MLAAAAVSALIEEHHGKGWLSLIALISPIVLLGQLLEPSRRRRRQARRAKQDHEDTVASQEG